MNTPSPSRFCTASIAVLSGTRTSWKMYETNCFLLCSARRSIVCAVCSSVYCVRSCWRSRKICRSARSRQYTHMLM